MRRLGVQKTIGEDRIRTADPSWRKRYSRTSDKKQRNWPAAMVVLHHWTMGSRWWPIMLCITFFLFCYSFVIIILIVLPSFFLSYQTTSAYEFYFFSNSLSYLTAERSEQTLVWCLFTCHRSQSCKLTQRKKLSAMQAQTSTAASPFSPLADQDKGLLTETIYSVNPSSSWPWTHRLFRSWP